MADYPILLNIEGRLCVVVGGGTVGLRKVRGLLEAGARVRLIDPAPAAVPGGAELLRRPYRDGDLDGAALAFAASGERRVNAAVAAEARCRGIPVNVADVPEEGGFTLPALLPRGALTVAVATGGESPALAAVLAERLGEAFGPQWEGVLQIAAALRRKRLTLAEGAEYNQSILRRLLDGGLPDLVAAGDEAAVDRLLQTLCGDGCSLAQLGVRLAKGMT
jgi:precorrin-2 dehydrogenase/sirohydrochlorin ferrochelatase